MLEWQKQRLPAGLGGFREVRARVVGPLSRVLHEPLAEADIPGPWYPPSNSLKTPVLERSDPTESS